VPATSDEPALELRAAVQRFVRSFGLLAGDQTPCGEPLAPSHAHALMLLFEAGHTGQRLSQQALASALGIDKSTVARLCAKMERAGHVDQQRPVVDERARLVGLTAKGKRVAERVESASRARFRDVLAAMPSAHDCHSLIVAIQRLNEAITIVSRSQNDA
jgi:DNA-binding MarR family transcriptional regulator